MINVKSACPPAATVEQAGQVGEAFGEAYLRVYSTSPPRSRQLGTSVFQEVRERVTAEDTARHFGMEFDRRGWCRCPFHGDTHASMSFRAGRFRCWACGASGDSIDFTGRLLGLDALGAVERLNSDFMLWLELDKPPDAETMRAAQRRRKLTDTYQRFEQWRTATIRTLNACFRLAHEAIRDLEAPEDLDKLTDGQALAIREHSPALNGWPTR